MRQCGACGKRHHPTQHGPSAEALALVEAIREVEEARQLGESDEETLQRLVNQWSDLRNAGDMLLRAVEGDAASASHGPPMKRRRAVPRRSTGERYPFQVCRVV